MFVWYSVALYFYYWDFSNNLKLGKKLKSLQKCQIFVIFITAEIHKIDLEALFFRILKILMVKIQKGSWGITDFTEANFSNLVTWEHFSTMQVTGWHRSDAWQLLEVFGESYSKSILSRLKTILSPMKFIRMRDIPQLHECTKFQLILTWNTGEIAYFRLAMVTNFRKVHPILTVWISYIWHLILSCNTPFQKLHNLSCLETRFRLLYNWYFIAQQP